MAEGFDTWQGFVDAGFASAGDGALHLGDAGAACVVTKAGTVVRAVFSSKVPEFERIAFDLPGAFDDMWAWAASIASRTFGSRRAWERFCGGLSEPVDRDLAQIIEIGLDHLDDASTTEGAAASAGDGEESTAAVGGVDVEQGDDAGAGVVEWPGCLHDVVQAALRAEWQKMSDSVQAQDTERSRLSLERVNRLKAMHGRITELAEAWKALGLGEIAVAKGGTKGSIPTRSVPATPVAERAATPSAKSVATVRGEPQGPMGFAVTFEDGTRIAEAKDSLTFAKAIEKIGAERVAALGFKMAGDPLVTRDRSEIKKMPMMMQPIADGWFVKTHSNSYTKVDFLRRMGEALRVAMQFELFHRTPAEQPPQKRGRGRPPKAPPPLREKFQIGRVVRWAFPRLFKRGDVTDDEVNAFLAEESRHTFGTRGYPVLKDAVTSPESVSAGGHRRYYADVRLERNGHVYLLTSQFITAESEAILSWLASKGFSRDEMDCVGRGEVKDAEGSDDLPLFMAHDAPCGDSGERDASRSGGTQEEVHAAETLSLEIQEPPSLFDMLGETWGTDAKESSPSSGGDAPSSVVQRQSVSASEVKERLRFAMKRLALTPRKLASELHLPRRFVKRWYKGCGVISAEEYAALFHRLGL